MPIKGLVGTLFYLMIGLSLNLSCKPNFEPAQTDKKTPLSLAPPVEKIINKKIEALDALMAESVFVEALQQANLAHKRITFREITKRDKAWRAASEDSALVADMLSEPCSKRLIEFQKEEPAISEVFITDAKGLNICLTNKTTDYLQSDEAWWQTTADRGSQGGYFGLIEYDESAKTKAIPVYTLGFLEKTGQLAGVMKAVVSIELVQHEL